LDTDVFFPLDPLLAFADVTAEFPQAIANLSFAYSKHFLEVLVFGVAIPALLSERGDFSVEEFGRGRQPFVGEDRPGEGDAVRLVGHGTPP
jgi:hypothetical protein